MIQNSEVVQLLLPKILPVLSQFCGVASLSVLVFLAVVVDGTTTAPTHSLGFIKIIVAHFAVHLRTFKVHPKATRRIIIVAHTRR